MVFYMVLIHNVNGEWALNGSPQCYYVLVSVTHNELPLCIICARQINFSFTLLYSLQLHRSVLLARSQGPLESCDPKCDVKCEWPLKKNRYGALYLSIGLRCCTINLQNWTRV